MKRYILLAITCVFLYFVFRNIDIIELLNEIKNIDIKCIFYLIISIILSLACRGICFKILISKTTDAPLKDLIPLCITGAALNIVLPARAGDFFRAYYTGNKYNADKVKILGTVILERIFDGLIILAMLLCGIFLYNKDPLAQKLCIGASIIFIGCLSVVLLALKFNKTDSICNFLEKIVNNFPAGMKNIGISFIQFMNKICNSFINGFEILKYPNKFLGIILASIGIWFFECLNYYIMIIAFGLNVDWSIVLFIISFIALACMIPSTSIFIGPYQFAIIAAFAIYHLNKETALAISFVEQTIVTLTTSIIAAIFLIKNNIEYKNINRITKEDFDG